LDLFLFAYMVLFGLILILFIILFINEKYIITGINRLNKFNLEKNVFTKLVVRFLSYSIRDIKYL
jgi:hypothetical protein